MRKLRFFSFLVFLIINKFREAFLKECIGKEGLFYFKIEMFHLEWKQYALNTNVGELIFLEENVVAEKGYFVMNFLNLTKNFREIVVAVIYLYQIIYFP
jgi:hypothetical protein